MIVRLVAGAKVASGLDLDVDIVDSQVVRVQCLAVDVVVDSSCLAVQVLVDGGQVVGDHCSAVVYGGQVVGDHCSAVVDGGQVVGDHCSAVDDGGQVERVAQKTNDIEPRSRDLTRPNVEH